MTAIIPTDKLTPLGNPHLSHTRPWNTPQFWYGACYYPEHWDAPTRAEDAARMAAAGMNLVRMSEFAWDRMEPSEGKFDFSFFDEIISTLASHGISTMLCTPTATAPRWLTAAHPELLRVNEQGIPMRHGSRQQTCYGNPLYREYSRRITRAMAEHFKNNPHVVGWQTDNEFHCLFSECHCASCQTQFRLFLKERFQGEIARLNEAWGTAFWSQTYSGFGEIDTPQDGRPCAINPGQRLDYFRYLSEIITLFQHDQVQILRQHNPRWFIQHNGGFSHIDYRGLFLRDLDVLGFDSYPMFENDPEKRPLTQQIFLSDLMRSLSGNFMIIEQQSGPGGAGSFMTETAAPGEVRSMAWRSVARGADSLLYFRWRTCRFGAEMYWCGILDHDNIPRRRYDEVARTGNELKKIAPQLLGTHVVVEAAQAGHDYLVGDLHSTTTLGLPAMVETNQLICRHLHAAHFAAGMVHPEDSLEGLKLYIIPHWPLFKPGWVPALADWVAKGGTLVIGARSGTRLENNHVTSQTLPGTLRELAGVSVIEYGKLNPPGTDHPSLLLPGHVSLKAELWMEILHCESASPWASWKGRLADGRTAISLNKVGAGRVFYVGTYLTESTFPALLPHFAAAAGLQPLWPDLPKGVDVSLRTEGTKKIWFFINSTLSPLELKTTPSGANLITGLVSGGPLTLEPHGVAIIQN
ncbi:MAG: beta-galactosidase [Verrucomicrobiae bacterium]|nr:beta-galactosidase [Verrucomicrobiae bacterium]